MAWYDASHDACVRAIERSCASASLPLELIRETIDAPPRRTISRRPRDRAVLAEHTRHAVRARARELDRARSAEAQIRVARGRAGSRCPGPTGVHGDDLALLVTLGAARGAGTSPEMLPFAILGEYVRRCAGCVEIDSGCSAPACCRARATPDRGRPLTDAATRLSERLVVLLRRKLLLPTLHRLMKETDHVATCSPGPRPARSRVRMRPATRSRRRPERVTVPMRRPHTSDPTPRRSATPRTTGHTPTR